ncbi:MAG: hypothetical protein HZC47_00700 [Methanobacterium sp.]|uniref:hypothetical protein n=1 Tax=Methanobacterium sp. TaxID=2164 RepID=UPI003D660BE7|nr:hypothetical protein [Methanobacterium sp.]
MAKHKVLSAKDNGSFIKTASFYKLYNVLKTLKTSKGRFVLVLGAPGTGKSANIYQALSLLDLDIYDAYLFIDTDTKPSKVFRIFWDTLKKDMQAKSREEVYQMASKYDLILFADPFLDSEYIDKDKVGLGLWTEENGPSTFPFYFRVLYEYLKHRKDLKNVNVVSQTSWVLKFRGVRYDILTDFGFISKILVFLLKKLFDVVLISYTSEEMMKIIRSHPGAVSDEKIEEYIKEYGNRPRFIFEALDKEENY